MLHYDDDAGDVVVVWLFRFCVFLHQRQSVLHHQAPPPPLFASRVEPGEIGWCVVVGSEMRLNQEKDGELSTHSTTRERAHWCGGGVTCHYLVARQSKLKD